MEAIGKTTDDALAEIFKVRAWYKGTSITKNQADNYKNRFENGGLTLDKKEEILIAAGKKVVQEKLWK